MTRSTLHADIVRVPEGPVRVVVSHNRTGCGEFVTTLRDCALWTLATAKGVHATRCHLESALYLWPV